MEEASYLILIVLGMVAFNAYREGRLGDWMRAKFFNAGQPSLPLGDALTVPDAGAGTVKPAGGFLANLVRGVLGYPLANPPSSPSSGFGVDRGTHTHAGVDWAVPQGTPVLASTGGRVTFAGAKGSYGLTVDVDHGNGLSTRYAHLSRLTVRAGQDVSAGHQLGLSGNTGRSTGPHLHFEVRQDGTPVDPLGALGGAGLTGGVLA